MYVPRLSNTIELTLLCVSDKDKILYKFKKDGRRKMKPIPIELKVDGGVLSANVLLKSIEDKDVGMDVKVVLCK